MRALLVLAAWLPSMLVAQAERPPSTVDLVRAVAAGGEAATEAALGLKKRGRFALRPVLDALATTEDPAARRRLDEIATFCRVPGDPVDGLKAALTVPSMPVAVGADVALEITLCNASDRPLVLFAGFDVAGSALENGDALRLVVRRGGPDAPAEAVLPVYTRALCGTGARPVLETLPPWTARTFRSTARVMPGSTASDVAPSRQLRLSFADGLCVLPLGATGAHVLRCELHVPPTVRDFVELPDGVSRAWFGDLVTDEATLVVRG